jgi:hypothetical protein
MRLNMSLLIVGSLVFFLSACKKSPPTPAVAAGADWTMYGGTNDEQRGGGIRSRQSSRADLPVAVKDQRARGPAQQETDPPTGIDPPTGTATSGRCRQALSDQADAILETASALVTLDRRNLEAARHSANTALAALPAFEWKRETRE